MRPYIGTEVRPAPWPWRWFGAKRCRAFCLECEWTGCEWDGERGQRSATLDAMWHDAQHDWRDIWRRYARQLWEL